MRKDRKEEEKIKSAEKTPPKRMFTWGTATSPTLVEGETVNEWAGVPAKDGSVCDDGPKHWRRYRYDFKSMSGLGFKAYLFGCDWGRLQRGPYENFEREAAYRYLEMLAELRSLGIEPWLVLFDNALPRWAARQGGWLCRETPYWFADFTERLLKLTDGEVLHFATLSCPKHYALSAYLWGNLLPRQWGRPDLAWKVLNALTKGHQLAREVIKKQLPSAKAGIILDSIHYVPDRKYHPGDIVSASLADLLINRLRYKRFVKNSDFLIMKTGGSLKARPGKVISLSSGLSPEIMKTCPLQPESGQQQLKQKINRLRQYAELPVYLLYSLPELKVAASETENLVINHLKKCHAEEAVSGIFLEPFLDGFDWTDGLTRKKGLLSVDLNDSERRRETKPFARMLAKIIQPDF